MPTLYPQNDQYQDTSGVTPKDFSALGNATKAAMEGIAGAPPPPDTSNYVQNPAGSSYGSSTPVNTSDFYKNTQFTDMQPTGVPLGERSTDSQQPLSPGYSWPKPTTNPITGEVSSAPASPETYIRNWPEALGGGQYAIDPTQPDKFVKSWGNDIGITPQEAAQLRGGRSSADIKVDYIIPVADGGTNTYSNKAAFSTSDYIQKQKVEAVSNTLYERGLITKDEKFKMDVGWRDHNTSNIPMPDQFGYISNLSPEQVSSFKQKGSEGESEYYKALGMDSKVADINKQWTTDAQNPSSGTSTWKEIPNEMNNVLGDGVLGSFGKGLVSGATFGLVNAAPVPEDNGFFNRVASVVGNVIGSFVPIALFASGLGEIGAALAGTAELGALAESAAAPTFFGKALPWAGRVISEVAEGGNVAKKTSGVLSRARNLFGGAKMVEQTATAAEEAANYAKDISNPESILGRTNPILKPWVASSLFFGSTAVAEQLTREGMGVEDHQNFMNHALNFATSAATGGIFATSGQNLGGYAKIGGFSLILSLMDGQSSGQNTLQNAFINAVTMVGLHGMASDKVRNLGLLGPTLSGTGKSSEFGVLSGKTPQELIETHLQNSAIQMGNKFLNEYAPNATIKGGEGSRPYTKKELASIAQEAEATIYQEALSSEWPDSKRTSALNALKGAVAAVRTNGMNSVLVSQKLAKDITSTAKRGNEQAKNTVPSTGDTPAPQELHGLYGHGTDPIPAINIPSTDVLNGKGINPEASGKISPISGKPIPTTGYGENLGKDGKPNPLYNNMNAFYKALKAGKVSDTVFMVDRGPENLDARLTENKNLVGSKTQTGRTWIPNAHPENTIEIWGYLPVPDGKGGTIPDFRLLSYAVRKSNMDDMNQYAKRLKATQGSQGITYSIDKDEITNSMRENGLKILPAKIIKVYSDPIAGLSTPSGTSENPRFHMRIMTNDATIQDAIKRQQGGNNGNISPTSSPGGPRPGEPNVPSDLNKNILGGPLKGKVPLADKITTVAGAAKDLAISPKDKAALEKMGINTEGARVVPNKSPVTTVDYSKQPEVLGTQEGGKKADLLTFPKDLKHYEFNIFPEGVNKGTSKIIDEKISSLPEGSPETAKLEKFRDTITKESLKSSAEKILKVAKGDENRGADYFINHISDQFTKRGLIDPTSTYENKQVFRKIFRDSVINKPMKVLTVDKEGNFKEGLATSEHPKSFFEKNLEATTGIKDVVYLEDGVKDISKEDSEQSDNESSTKRVDSGGFKKPVKLDAETVKKNFIDKGYVPFFYDNGVGSALGIKFNSDLAGGKKITDPGAMDEFAKSIVKATGFKVGESSINSFAKRFKSLNSHEKESPIKGETHTIYVIKDSSGFNKTVKERTPNWDDIKINPVVPNAAKTKEDLGKFPGDDGQTKTSPELLQKKGELSGYTHKPYYLKDTVSHIDPQGNLLHIKHETRAYSPEEKTAFEDFLGKPLTPTDHVTMEGNVKEGLNTSMAKDMGKYWEIKVPSEAWSMKYQNPHDVGASLSAGSVLSKVPTDIPSDVIDKVTGPYKEYAKAIQDVSNDFHNFDGTTTIDEIWKKYPELKKNKYLENLYGELQKSAQNGAGVTELGQNLNTAISSIVKDKYFKGRFFKGDTLHIMTDSGQQKNDPVTGQKTYLNSGEIMIPKESFIASHGNEAYKQLKDGKDTSVLAYRYPTLKPTSIARMKVLIAEDHGVDMGNAQAVINAADAKGIFDSDVDGDTVQYMKIGDKNGIPEELAKHFDSEHKKGEMYFPQLKSTPKVPFDGKNTFSKIMNYTDNNLNGGEAIGIAAAGTRPMRELIANDFKIEVGPSTGSKRTVTTYLNGKVDTKSDIPEVVKGENIFPKSPKESFVIKPTFGDKEAFDMGFMGQAAADANGKSDLSDILKPYGGNAAAYVNDKLFTNAKDAGAGSIIFNALKDFQTPYRLDKLKGNVMENLDPYIKKQKEIKATGGKVGIAAELALVLDGLKPIDNYFGNKEVQTDMDNSGGENVIKNFKESVSKNPTTQKVEDFKIFYKNTTHNGTLNEEKKNTINKKYDEIKKSLTKDEKMKLSYWVASDPTANIMSQNSPKTRGFVQRSLHIINDTPDVAKAYFSGANKYKETQKKRGGNPSFFLGFENLFKGKGGPGKKDFSKTKGGDFIVIRHGATKNNEDGLNRGMLNLELSPKGKEEAKEIAPKVAEEGLTGLIASPLLRAQQTADIISKETSIPVLETNKALLPWAIGEFQGKSIKDTLPELHKYMDNPDKPIPGGGESFNQFKERTIGGMKDIHKRYPNEKLGIVTHHRVANLMEAISNEKSGHGNFDLTTQKTPGIDPGKFQEINWNYLFPTKDGKGGPGKYSSLTPKAIQYPEPVSKQLKVKYGGVIGAVRKGMSTKM